MLGLWILNKFQLSKVFYLTCLVFQEIKKNNILRYSIWMKVLYSIDIYFTFQQEVSYGLDWSIMFNLWRRLYSIKVDGIRIHPLCIKLALQLSSLAEFAWVLLHSHEQYPNVSVSLRRLQSHLKHENVVVLEQWLLVIIVGTLNNFLCIFKFN